MIVTGISAAQFSDIVTKLNTSTYLDNLVASIGHIHSPNRFTARVIVRDSGSRRFRHEKGQMRMWSAPGARRSASGRRLPAACWHAYRDVLAAIFDVNPDARVYTAMARYIGRDGFYAEYPKTATHNIGSAAAPAYMPDLCDCHRYGVSEHEQG